MKRHLMPLLAASALLVAGAGTATADPSTSANPSAPVTITLSPEQVTALCEKRLPRLEQRTTRLLDRINGDAQTRGSVEWLRARATKEREAGRETSAELLDERADRRAGRVDDIDQVKQRLTDFRTAHCESK